MSRFRLSALSDIIVKSVFDWAFAILPRREIWSTNSGIGVLILFPISTVALCQPSSIRRT